MESGYGGFSEDFNDDSGKRANYVQAIASALEHAGLDSSKAEQVLEGIELKTTYQLVSRGVSE